jgi:hypothetical protein
MRPSISSAILLPSSPQAVRSRAPCCYLHPPSPSSAISSPSSSRAVHPRNPSYPDSDPQALKPCVLEFQTFSCYLRSPQGFYHHQASTLCALERHAATFTLRHPPRRFYTPQALKLCALQIQAIRIATLKLTSCELSSSRPESHCYLRSPRRFYHPQAPKLCALELQTFSCYLRSPQQFYYPQAPKLCAPERHAAT